MRHFRPVAIAALLTAVAAACSAPSHDAVAKDSATKPGDALAAAVAAPTRTPANVARDKYRHPAETLAFFGVKPGDTVVELWPGAGWYTEILAPLAKTGGGTLYAAHQVIGAGRADRTNHREHPNRSGGRETGRAG